MKKMNMAAVAALGLAFLLAGCGGNATDDNDSSSVILYGILMDSRDGKSYRTVEMPGGNTWMAENLNYNAGGSWCYDDNTNNCAAYGRLYDWATAINVCPSGWHLPSDDEWSALAIAVGGEETAGAKLKSGSGWGEGNGTDDYGFSALSGGYRSGDGSFYSFGSIGNWWSATESDTSLAYYRSLGYRSTDLGRGNDSKEFGFSVRCIRD